MMGGLQVVVSGELAFRLAESVGPNAWMVVVTDSNLADVAQALASEVQQLSGIAAVVAADRTPQTLRETFRDAQEGVCVAFGVSSFTSDDWSWADVSRSRFERSGTTVLLLDAAGLELLQRCAPNISSWVGGNACRLVDAAPLDDEGVRARLDALREWSGKTDDEVIKLAEAGDLPTDPSYAEWITLLNRGELLVG